MKPKRRRKPETVMRYLRNSIVIAKAWNGLDRGTGNHWVDVSQELFCTLRLLRELRASLKRGNGGRP